MGKILSIKEYKEKYPNGRMRTATAVKGPAPKSTMEPVAPKEVPLAQLANFLPEARQAALWDEFKRTAVNAVEFRDCESVDECIRVLQALHPLLEVKVPDPE